MFQLRVLIPLKPAEHRAERRANAGGCRGGRAGFPEEMVLEPTLKGSICSIQSFSNLSVHKNHLGIMSKYRFCFSRLGWGLRFRISNKLQVLLMLLVCGPHFE